MVRKAAGIDFPGSDPSTSWMIAQVEMDDEPEIGTRPEGGGIGPVDRVKGGGPYGVVLKEQQIEHTGEPTLTDLRAALVDAYGTDFGVHSPNWISRFTDATRQAASYRQGRVLLAGDAAHVHPPQGGQGLNTGVQDAVNLGWKLAQVVDKTSPERLLDTYHAERHPVGARVLRNTMAHVALSNPDDRHRALHDIVAELLSMDEPRRRIAAMQSGLDIHYDLGDGHPLLGRRMPDLDVHTADGPTRVFTLLHDARPVLLNLGEPGGFDIAPWAHRVQFVDAEHVGVWELPVVGEVAAPAAVLIRPDGHVAWAGDLTDPELPSRTCDLVRRGRSGLRNEGRYSARRVEPTVRRTLRRAGTSATSVANTTRPSAATAMAMSGVAGNGTTKLPRATAFQPTRPVSTPSGMPITSATSARLVAAATSTPTACWRVKPSDRRIAMSRRRSIAVMNTAWMSAAAPRNAKKSASTKGSRAIWSRFRTGPGGWGVLSSVMPNGNRLSSAANAA